MCWQGGGVLKSLTFADGGEGGSKNRQKYADVIYDSSLGHAVLLIHVLSNTIKFAYSSVPKDNLVTIQICVDSVTQPPKKHQPISAAVLQNPSEALYTLIVQIKKTTNYSNVVDYSI